LGTPPLGVSRGETPAGIRVLRLWRKATNWLGTPPLGVSRGETPAGIRVLRLRRKATNWLGDA